MAVFDQRGQRVNYQYNAAGNINFGPIQNRAEVVDELKKLLTELDTATQAGVLDEEVATDTEYQLKKAVQQAQKPEANKQTILDYLNQGKELISGIKAASGFVGALSDAVGKVQALF